MTQEELNRLAEESTVFPIIPGRYFACMWFCATTTMDVAGSVFRDGDDQDWHIRYRFRYYDPKHQDPFAGKDEKHAFEKVVSRSMPETEILVKAQGMMEMFTLMARNLAKADFEIVDFVPLCTSDFDAIIDRLKSKSWAHFKIKEM